MTQSMDDFGMRIHLNLPYEEAIARATDALKAEGFGVLSEIDVKATLKKKLDVDFRRYVILGACNPPLAHRAFSNDLEIGLLLPCNVIVYEDEAETGSTVSIVNPMMMFSTGMNPDMAPVAEEATTRLKRVLAALEKAN